MRYQLAVRPIATATGEAAEWSIGPRIHDSRRVAEASKRHLWSLGFQAKLLPVG